jgi:hypothetical protein
MKLVENTRSKAGELFLKKEFERIKNNRHKQVSTFKSAEIVALLFDASDPEEFELVKKYIKRLKEEKIKVKALGYYHSKEMPALMASKLEYDFFTKKQLKWYLKPDNPIVENFINEPFDLLINLSMKTLTPLLYVMALSKAKFKVGLHNNKYLKYYDLTIKMPAGSHLRAFIPAVEKYVNMLKSE